MVEEAHRSADLRRGFDVALEIGFGQTRLQCASASCVDRQPISLHSIDWRPVTLENANTDALSAKAMSETEPACPCANDHYREITHGLADAVDELLQERSELRTRSQQERSRPYAVPVF
jgi:hypothetical protein